MQKKTEHSSCKIDNVDAKNMIRGGVVSLPRNNAHAEWLLRGASDAGAK